MKIAYLLLLIIVSSCGKQDSLWPSKVIETASVEPAIAELYSYEFRGSKCTTNVQSFETFNKACAGLRDNELNNNCAANKREELFLNENCPGSFI